MMRVLASVLVVVAACGRQTHRTIDAPPAEPDAEVMDNGEPTTTSVQLTITRLSSPVPGATVIFQDAASTVIQTALTDNAGRAWAELPAGGFVTAINHIEGNNELTTFSAVQPGDALRLDLTPIVNGTVHVFTLTVPTENGSDGYQVRTSCGMAGLDATGTGEITLEGCAGVADIAVVPTVDGLPVARALFVPAQNLPASGPLTLTGTYDTMAMHSISYSAVPGHVQSLAAYRAITPQRRGFEAAAADAPTGGALTLQLELPATQADQLTVTNQYPTAGEVGQQSIYEWGAASTAYALNLSATMLPAFASAPAFDATTRTLAWTERPSAAEPDAVRARLSIYRDDIPSGTGWKWRIAAPRSATSIAFPTLPVGMFDFNPQAGDTIVVDDLATLRVTGGYAAVRVNPFADATRSIVGATGRIVLQTLYYEEPIEL